MSWTYYLFWIAFSTGLTIVLAHPSVLVVAVIAVVARRWIPDPVLFVKHAARVRSLRTEVELNPANAVARARLAEIWLDKRRPRRAIPLIEQALERDPTSPDLLYLLGVARLRSGNPELALEPLAAALARDPKLHYGSAYLAIGDALVALARLDEATEAYERYVKINTSSLEGYYKLARARKSNHDDEGARRARAEALDTYRVLPRYQRRKQLLWWLRARLTS